MYSFKDDIQLSIHDYGWLKHPIIGWCQFLCKDISKDNVIFDTAGICAEPRVDVLYVCKVCDKTNYYKSWVYSGMCCIALLQTSAENRPARCLP